MWPPSSGCARLARTTMASAFQRTIAERRLSSSRLPGNCGWSASATEFLYGRVEHRRQRHAARARVVEQLAQQEGGALAALGCDQGVEGLQPLAGFDRVGVRRIDPPEGGGNDVGEVGHPSMVIAGSRRWPPRKQIGYQRKPLSPCRPEKTMLRSRRRMRFKQRICRPSSPPQSAASVVAVKSTS